MPNTGTIITRCYTSDAQLPVSGAGILFFRRTDAGGRELLAVRVSDVSGKTEPVAVDTPTAEQSQFPAGSAGDDPVWTNVDLVAVHPEYASILVENLQVFPGTVTVQELQFIPAEPGSSVHEQTEHIDTTPQSLG